MTAPGGEVSIESIDIGVAGGVQPDTARELAQLVAQRLAGSLQLGPGEAAIERLELVLSANAGEEPQALATRIATQLALLIADTSVLEAGR
jgi:hypothetical protein